MEWLKRAIAPAINEVRMRKFSIFVLFTTLVSSGSALAYLSADGTKLANGGGVCKVCDVGWTANSNGTYNCSGTVTTQENCRPAAAMVKGLGAHNLGKINGSKKTTVGKSYDVNGN